MRTLLISLLLLAMPLISLAQDCACPTDGEAGVAVVECTACPACASVEQLAADRAGVCISHDSVCLTGSTPCDWPRHRCAPTLYPCEPCLPVRCVMHRPLACVTLCPAPVCLPRACHQPVVTMWVDDPCPVDVVLTGTPDVIRHCCACDSCEH